MIKYLFLKDRRINSMSKYSIDSIKHKTNLKFVFFWTHYVTKGCYTPAVLSQWYESPFTIDGINIEIDL